MHPSGLHFDNAARVADQLPCFLQSNEISIEQLTCQQILGPNSSHYSQGLTLVEMTVPPDAMLVFVVL